MVYNKTRTSILVSCMTGLIPLGTWYTSPLVGGMKGSSAPSFRYSSNAPNNSPAGSPPRVMGCQFNFAIWCSPPSLTMGVAIARPKKSDPCRVRGGR